MKKPRRFIRTAGETADRSDLPTLLLLFLPGNQQRRRNVDRATERAGGFLVNGRTNEPSRIIRTDGPTT